MSSATNTALSAALDELASTMTGELVRPGDAAYDEARSVWNGMIDLRPAGDRALRLHRGRPRSAAHRERHAGLPLAVRGGGHNVAGFGTIDDGLVIDLSPLSAVTSIPTTGACVRAAAPRSRISTRRRRRTGWSSRRASSARRASRV